MIRAVSQAVILQHVPYAGPGRIAPMFRDYGIPVQVRHLYRGDEPPVDLDEVRVLVVLSGPMRIQQIADSQFPFLAQEIETLRRTIAADRPVLGIGLGAQLLAHAAGAKVFPNTRPPVRPEDPSVPAPEFGWAPVTFPFPGGTEPLVFGLVDGSPVFHWHFDTFDLPRLHAPSNPAPPPAPPPPTGNSLLCSSRVCRNQAFRFKSRLFGFQFHFELTEHDIESLLDNESEILRTVGDAELPKRIRSETPGFYPRYARTGARIVENFVQFLKAY
ncbi:MAG: type 1 glutamine amidotransferase [Tepidisphaeraceae bacterium]